MISNDILSKPPNKQTAHKPVLSQPPRRGAREELGIADLGTGVQIRAAVKSRCWISCLPNLESIAVSLFVDNLVDFDKYQL